MNLLEEIKDIKKSVVFFNSKSGLIARPPVRGTPSGDFLYVCDIAITLIEQCELITKEYQSLLKEKGMVPDGVLDSDDRSIDGECISGLRTDTLVKDTSQAQKDHTAISG